MTNRRCAAIKRGRGPRFNVRESRKFVNNTDLGSRRNSTLLTCGPGHSRFFPDRPMNSQLSMRDISLESLEEKFRAVEEASERRALCSDEPRTTDATATAASMNCEPSNSTRRSASTSHRVRILKRPASVSFFGQSVSQTSSSSCRSSPSPIPTAAPQPASCPTLAKSKYGFETFISKDRDDEHPREGDRVIEVRRTAGRHALQNAMGSLLPRRISRTRLRRSQSVFVTGDVNVVVGVSVEQTTSALDCSDSPSDQCFTVHAPKRGRARAFTVDFPSSDSSARSLAQRAMDFARRMRRKQPI